MWLKVPGEERSTMKSCLPMSRREADTEVGRYVPVLMPVTAEVHHGMALCLD
jgi:hypothetical protein